MLGLVKGLERSTWLIAILNTSVRLIELEADLIEKSIVATSQNGMDSYIEGTHFAWQSRKGCREITVWDYLW